MTEDSELTSIAPRGHRSKQAEREARLAPTVREVKRTDAVPQEDEHKEAKKETEIEALKKRIAELERG